MDNGHSVYIDDIEDEPGRGMTRILMTYKMVIIGLSRQYGLY